MIIEARYNGPPGSANGGYAAGLFAAEIPWGGPPEVTLRRPPPLATALTTVPAEAGAEIRTAATGELLAQVRPTTPFTADVPAVTWSTAVEAAAGYAGHTEHPFPGCYVCGPTRSDGLRVFPGRLPDGRTAAPFVVPPEVRPEIVWAALDCPGGWSVLSAGRPYLLGRIAAVISALPAPGERCVVLGACQRVEGRKALVHTTLYGSAGSRLAYARATWIAVQP